MPVTLERRYRFSAAHLYRRPDWTEAENRRRFGKCAIEPGHGHNYRLWVAVTGEVDRETGFVVDLGELDRLVHERVIELVDHRHLNHALEEFRLDGGQVPSTENLVAWVRGRLEGALPEGVELVELRLAEDDDLAAVWRSAG